MTQAPTLQVLGVDLFESPYTLRLPFRFGVITVTEGVQALVRARIRLANGREACGYAAEALGAKWFDKNPALSDEDNRHQLRRALELTRAAYLAAPPLTAFGLHARAHADLLQVGADEALPPLVVSYGPALIDRAVLDALCRLLGISFFDAMRANLPGLDAALTPDLAGFDLDAMLAGLHPQPRIAVRHTVGLLDAITAADLTPATHVHDGLPQTLEEVIARHGNRYFKVKVAGHLHQDLERLAQIAAVLDATGTAYHVTLDGNEQYQNVTGITALWEAARARPALARFTARTLLIEQPIHRGQALAAPVQALARHLPVIIDESDGDIDVFPRARALGYTGVTTKACKGFYKSLLNLARCRLWNAREGRERYFMSAEDLTTQPGTAVQQDLALVALMGLTHIERNAHHFIDGFNGRPRAEALTFLRAHPDLYREDSGGHVRLHIERGALALGSLDAPGFGSAVAPQLDATAPMPLAAWPRRA